MPTGFRRFSDRAVAGGIAGPRLEAGESLMHVVPCVAVAIASGLLESPGILFVTAKRVIWLSDADGEKGYSVDFLSISLHTVCRDPDAYPWPCIYAQIDAVDNEGMESDSSNSECSERFDASKVTEMRLVPSDPSQLDTLFDIFSLCAVLNPEDGEEENTRFYSDEEMDDEGNGCETSCKSLNGQFQRILLTPLVMQMEIVSSLH